MIRERLILRGLVVHYVNNPTVKVYVDGASDPAYTITLPSNPTYRTRVLTVPAGHIGYIFKVESDATEEIDLKEMTEPTSNYTRLQYWDYYEVTFSGTINVSLYLDDTATAVISATTLTTTKVQDTQMVYFPSNSYGRIPFFVLTTSNTNDGNLISHHPVAKGANSLTDTELSVVRSLRLIYKGSPQVVMSLDGSVLKTIATNTLPNNSEYKPKTISVPSGSIGYFPHFTSTDSSNIADFSFVTEPSGFYSDQVVWHFYEITFKGTINVSLYLDNVLVVGDGDDADNNTTKKTLTTTKVQDTKKVYLPALSYGRLPHVIHDVSDTGDVLKWSPVALPVRFYKTLEGVSECQITHKGVVFVDFYLDGEKLDETYQFDPTYDELGNSIYSVKKFLLPENPGGYVFQYIQVSGDGDIISVETDAHPLDFEPTLSEEPS